MEYVALGAAPGIAIARRHETACVGERGAALAQILVAIAETLAGTRQERNDRALVDAVNIEHEVVTVCAQFGDRRGDRLQIGPAACFLEPA